MAAGLLGPGCSTVLAATNDVVEQPFEFGEIQALEAAEVADENFAEACLAPRRSIEDRGELAFGCESRLRLLQPRDSSTRPCPADRMLECRKCSLVKLVGDVVHSFPGSTAGFCCLNLVKICGVGFFTF